MSLALRYCLSEFLDIDAELVLLHARGDVRVGLGVHVRIDPDGDGRLLPSAPARSLMTSSSCSLSMLNIMMPASDGHVDLDGGLAHARVDDLGRGDACLEGPEELTARYHVRAQAMPGHEGEDGHAWNWPSWQNRSGGRCRRAAPQRPGYGA
ncbi:MAG: hypothetical protein MZV70_73160 [Desulfobacterales bacterium]|nr:hypothetical protein [Desulfobacterales bacterium]